MNRKRLLIIEKSDELSGLTPSPDCQIFITYEPHQALSLLMGGGTLLKRDKYGEEKVRPHLLLMHVSFIADQGAEFLELIQKYYSLKSIRVFLFGAAEHQISADLQKRFNVAGYFLTPLDLDTLMIEAEKASQDVQPLIKRIFVTPAALMEEHIKPFFTKVASQKSLVYSSGKVVVKSKILCGGVTLAVASAVSVPALSDDNNIEKVKQPHKIVQQTYILPAEETAVVPQPEELPLKEEPSNARPVSKKTTVVVSPELNTAVDSALVSTMPEPVIYKIQVLEDTTEAGF